MTKHLFAAFLFASVAAPALSQSVPPKVAELRERALKDDYAFDIVEPEALRQNVAAWTTMLAILSGGIEPEPKRRKQR